MGIKSNLGRYASTNMEGGHAVRADPVFFNSISSLLTTNKFEKF